MSDAKNRQIIWWQSLESSIRGLDFRFKGDLLSRQDKVAATDALISMWLVWDQVLATVGEQTDYKRWCNAIAKVDLFDVLTVLKEADAYLLTQIERDLPIDYDDFKHHLRAFSPVSGAIIAPLKRLIALSDSRSPEIVKALRTCLLMPSKLNLKSELLEKEALEAYLSNEASLRPPCTMEEHTLLMKWFPYQEFGHYEDLDPHFGNGSTADAGRDLVEKYRSLCSDSLIHFLCQKTDMDEFCFPALQRTSKVCFVPKSFKSYRTISMEPATLNWYQEAFFDMFRKELSDGHYLARRYLPDHGDRNCELAYEGARTGKFDTIDLSAASDSVSDDLVRQWFHHTHWYPWLRACRSTHTQLPDGTVIPLRKYAPMGSCCTFAVETVVFAAMVECAIREYGEDPSLSGYAVYGDDIVVEHKYYDLVTERLELNGFRVNREKSYSGQGRHRFRESCGAHSLDGYDITPLIVSRQFTGYSGEYASWVPATVDFANETMFYPFCSNLRRYLIKRLTLLPPKLRPIFSDGNRGVYSPEPTNFHLESRVNPGLQAIEVKHGQTRIESRAYPECDAPYLLYEWLRATRKRECCTYPEDQVLLPKRQGRAQWGSTTSIDPLRGNPLLP